MAMSDGASGFAFISVDSPRPQEEHRTPLSLPDAEFRRILLALTASKLRGEEAMAATATSVRIRHNLHTRLLDARAQTDDLFGIVRNEAIYDRPIPERHRIIFYLGHVEAFDWNLLAQRAFGLTSVQRTFDNLFAFGIDPVGGGLPSDGPSDWPKREEVEHYNRRLRNELDLAIERALARPAEGHPQLIAMLEVAIEHRLMHAETLAYMLHRLPTDRKIRGTIGPSFGAERMKSRLVEIPAGRATLGLSSLLAMNSSGTTNWKRLQRTSRSLRLRAATLRIKIFCDLSKPAGMRTLRCGVKRRGPGRKTKGSNIPRFGSRMEIFGCTARCSVRSACRWTGPFT